MIRLTLAFLLITTGTASQYAPGVMQRVIAYRQSHAMTYALPPVLPVVDGYIAMRDARWIGRQVIVCPVGADFGKSDNDCRLMLVVDCAGPGAGAWMLNNGIILEMDYRSALHWDTVGRGLKVEVYLPTTTKLLREGYNEGFCIYKRGQSATVADLLPRACMGR